MKYVIGIVMQLPLILTVSMGLNKISPDTPFINFGCLVGLNILSNFGVRILHD